MTPTNATWGLENRTVAIRVKGLAGARLHTENRVPCGASNPYLVGAAAIAAGLDGIRNHIEPPPPIEGLAYGMEGPPAIPTLWVPESRSWVLSWEFVGQAIGP